MLVNNSRRITQVFKEAARAMRAELTVLETAESAASRLRVDRFEAIFADPSLPHFSRQGFVNLVRTSRFNSETPIVLVSSSGGKIEGAEFSAGVSLMREPSEPAELLPCLEQLKGKVKADRRKDRRLPFRTDVICVQGLRRVKATSVNVSSTGILIEINSVPQRGTEMELHFQLAANQPAFRGLARVVRIEGPNRAGLVFLNLGSAEQSRLRQFVEAHLPEVR